MTKLIKVLSSMSKPTGSETENEIFKTLSAAGVGEEKLDPKNAHLFAKYITENCQLTVDPNSKNRTISLTLDSLGVALGKLFKHDASYITDGSHDFEELYDHRCTLFLSIMAIMADSIDDNPYGVKSVWHSRLHDDGTGFDDYTVVGIETEFGNCTYHVKDAPYGDILRQRYPLLQLDRAPKWDGHTPSDVLTRLSRTFLGQPLSHKLRGN